MEESSYEEFYMSALKDFYKTAFESELTKTIAVISLEPFSSSKQLQKH